MQFESKLQHIQNLEERNKAFGALSNEDKRKEIAWDCFQLTLSGTVIGARGTFWSNSLYFSKSLTPEEFQKHLVNYLPRCEVCVRGGMMLSQIRLGNSLSPSTYDVECGTTENDESKKIMKGFTPTMFKYMEFVYEGWNERYYPYGRRTTEMLQNICLQVVAGGKFKLSDTTDYLRTYLKTNSK